MKNRLKELRAVRGWTQADLAAAVGVSRETIVWIERERYDPSLPLAFRLAAAFDSKVEQVFIPAAEEPVKDAG